LARALAEMSSAVRLPVELRQFLRLAGPQSLVIRGPPGSGKTTLALALLESAAGERLILTNRVSSGELAREFPWLGDAKSSRIVVVDSTDWEIPDRSISHAAADAAIAFDERSKEKRDVMEFLSLPGPVQEAWSRLPSDGTASTVVIDSWDALIEHYLGKMRPIGDRALERAEIERRLLRRMGSTPTHLVLVLETDAGTQLDYLVNGIALTSRELVDGRLERWLSLPKLRGIRIANASYPYTVEGAKFQCIDPLRPYTEMHSGVVDSEPEAMPGFVWPGSKSFAEAFGRLALGRVTLIEVDNEVPDYVVQHLVTPAKVHAIQTGGRVLVIPSPSLTSEEIWRPIEDAHPPGELSNYLHVLDVSGQLERATKGARPDRLACLVPTSSIMPSSQGGSPRANDIGRWVGGGATGGPPGLITMYETGIESLAIALNVPRSADLATSLTTSIQATLGEGTLHLIAVGRIDSPLLQSIRSLATIHLRLRDRQGRVLIYGMKPWTAGYVLTESAHAGPYDLLRIV
jgi:KaiC/GvpD/RAD55 family RecA-like ATPase